MCHRFHVVEVTVEFSHDVLSNLFFSTVLLLEQMVQNPASVTSSSSSSSSIVILFRALRSSWSIAQLFLQVTQNPPPKNSSPLGAFLLLVFLSLHPRRGVSVTTVTTATTHRLVPVDSSSWCYITPTPTPKHRLTALRRFNGR